MDVTYVLVVALVTYILGVFTKLKWDRIPNKYIPIQNLIIAIISTIICFFTKIETNLIQAFVLCLMSTMGAGGIADLMSILKNSD